MFTETRSRIEDNIWGAKGFSDKEASAVHAVLDSVRKAAGDLEEKDKEDVMDVEDVHSVDSESKGLETGSEGGTNWNVNSV